MTKKKLIEKKMNPAPTLERKTAALAGTAKESSEWASQ